MSAVLEAPPAPATVYQPGNWLEPSPESPRPQLVGGRCAACGAVFFPRFAACPDCGSREPMEPAPLSMTGSLYAYSVVRTNSPGFTAPYAIGYVDLPEGPRVFGHLDGWEGGAIPLGSTVSIYPGPIGTTPDGSTLVSIRFRRVGTASEGEVR